MLLNTESTSIWMVVKVKVKYSISLAIRDGANDVGMIQVGVVMCITFGVHLCIDYVIVTQCACLLPRLPTLGWGLVGVRDFRSRWLWMMLLPR